MMFAAAKPQTLGLMGLCASALLLVACGGGSETGSAVPPVAGQTLTGHFVDSPVAGLCYSASPSGLGGTTNATGDFSYRAGDVVSFALPTQGGACGSSAIALGSLSPVLPAAGGNAQAFVLGLPNGGEVAQVLQALNHGSTSAMNLSGLTIPAPTVTALRDYLANGAPAGLSPQNVLSAAQAATLLPPMATAFALPVSPGFGAAVAAHLTQYAGPTAGSVSAGDMVGPLWFRLDSENVASFVRFDSSSQKTEVLSARNGGAATPAQSSAVRMVGANIVALGGPYDNAVTTLWYLGGHNAYFSEVNVLPVQTAVGAYNKVQALSLAQVAGKTLALAGVGRCADGTRVDVVLQFNSDGTRVSPAANPASSYTVSAEPALAGLLKLVNAATGHTMYWGLPQGGNLEPGGAVRYLSSALGSQRGFEAYGQARVLSLPTLALPYCAG